GLIGSDSGGEYGRAAGALPSLRLREWDAGGHSACRAAFYGKSVADDRAGISGAYGLAQTPAAGVSLAGRRLAYFQRYRIPGSVSRGGPLRGLGPVTRIPNFHLPRNQPITPPRAHVLVASRAILVSRTGSAPIGCRSLSRSTPGSG